MSSYIFDRKRVYQKPPEFFAIELTSRNIYDINKELNGEITIYGGNQAIMRVGKHTVFIGHYLIIDDAGQVVRVVNADTYFRQYAPVPPAKLERERIGDDQQTTSD